MMDRIKINQEHKDRYLAATHAIQSALAYEEGIDPTPFRPKHLRVGVNMAMVEHGALVRLLVETGVLSVDDYAEALCEAAERELAELTNRLRKSTGIPGLNFG